MRRNTIVTAAAAAPTTAVKASGRHARDPACVSMWHGERVPMSDQWTASAYQEG
jgi:hypothetical protein